MDKNRRLFIYLPVVFALLIIAGIYIGMKVNNSGLDNELISRALLKRNSRETKVNDILTYIEQKYVDTINKKLLIETSLREMLQNLDPHSDYITAEELKAANEPLEGNFEGIGIEFTIIKDTIRVISAISGGPSETVGIMAGDKIVTIEGKNVAGVKITNEEVMKTLRGPGGTKVAVGIERRDSKKLLDFVITRGTIPLYSVDVAYMAAPEIGYIKISRFASTTYEEYMQAFEKLKTEGMRKLILDLRGNTGGLLSTAIDIADEFLEKGKQIVYTEGKAYPKQIYTASEKGEFEKNELIVLIDEGSASASEIVAGAVQDNDRGIIMGRKSFGKGLVQEQSEFPDGSAIRLTIARYYTPTGRCIQKPYNKGKEEYYKEEYERYENGELQHPDSIKFADSLKFTTPAGKIVYGGGGIMPDIFIPLDTTGRSQYLMEISYKGLLNQFAYNYADDNRSNIKKQYSSIPNYSKDFKIDDQVLNTFAVFAEKSGVKKNSNQLNHSRKTLSSQIKALIARNVWGNQGFYRVINSSDKAFQEALGQLQATQK